jgi:hypothetical protein
MMMSELIRGSRILAAHGRRGIGHRDKDLGTPFSTWSGDQSVAFSHVVTTTGRQLLHGVRRTEVGHVRGV